MAKPGYGKRSASGQLQAAADVFALLPERERYIAAFIDRLPEGAAMSVKTLAKQLPLYGQQAVSTALTALSVAGHLRRVRRPVVANDQVRWVFCTYWSRTAHDNEWWANYLTAEGTAAGATPTPAPPTPPASPGPVQPAHTPVPPQQQRDAAQTPEPSAPHTPGYPSPAYLALARLGHSEPRLALSAADCAALEERATEWLTRGATPAHLLQALTAGLPEEINSPRGFVLRRLNDKIPPLTSTAPATTTTSTPHGVMMECTECGTPGRPEALPDGLCRTCRSGTPQPAIEQAIAVTDRDVHALVAGLRDMLRHP